MIIKLMWKIEEINILFSRNIEKQRTFQDDRSAYKYA